MQILDNGILRVSILELGAELVSVRDGNDHERIVQPGPFWPGQAKNLFPNVGQIKDNCITVEGRRFRAQQHGFVKERYFTVTKMEKTRFVRFEMNADEQSRLFLPGDYRVVIEFELEKNRLCQRFSVYNNAEKALFFGLGSHTGFACDGPCELHFASDEQLVELMRPGMMFLNGHTQPFLTGDNGAVPLDVQKLFSEGARILDGFAHKRVSLLECESRRSVELEFSDFDYLALWGLPQTDEFVCLMPWCALPDYADTDHVFEHKPANRKLATGEVFSCSQTMTFNG